MSKINPLSMSKAVLDSLTLSDLPDTVSARLDCFELFWQSGDIRCRPLIRGNL